MRKQQTIRQSHSPEKVTISSDEDIIIKVEKEDEAVIKNGKKTRL